MGRAAHVFDVGHVVVEPGHGLTELIEEASESFVAGDIAHWSVVDVALDDECR